MRRAARVDKNQAEIVEALRGFGASVTSAAQMGSGFPDLVVGYAGMNFLVECKGPKGKLTPDQVKWHGAWAGNVAVIRTAGEALELLQGVNNGEGEE